MSVINNIVNPAATTDTQLLAALGSNVTGRVRVTICNRDAGASTVRLAVKEGATTGYILYDYSLGAASLPFEQVIDIDDTTELRCYASTANVDFIVNGRDDS